MKSSFEFFGYDFLIDEDFRIWLIECNSNPYIGKVNPYIKVLVENMLDDLFKTCLDPYFKPKHVDEPDRKNLFELIYSPGGTINSKEKVNQRREYTWDDLYISSETKDKFIEHRFAANKEKEAKLKNLRNKSPSKHIRKNKAVAPRDDSHIQNSQKKEPLQYFNSYHHTQNNMSNPKIRKSSHSREAKVDNKMTSVNGSRTETVFPVIKNVIEEKPPTRFINKNFINHNEILQKQKQKKLEDTQKIEEQITFLAKFNQDVRERNRLRSIKENGLSHNKIETQVKTLDPTHKNTDSCAKDTERTSITPSKRVAADGNFQKKYISLKEQRARLDLSTLNTGLDRKKGPIISTERKIKINVKKAKAESGNLSINSRLSESHTVEKKIKTPLEDKSQNKLPVLNHKHLSSEVGKQENSVKNENEKIKLRENNSIQTLMENSDQPFMGKKKSNKQTADGSKKKRIKDLKKLKQFSPYFVNLLKSQTKLSNLSKKFDFMDDKKSQNYKLYKVYGVEKPKRYKKKSQ